MKFNESWLREWVDPPITSEQLSEQLTMAGFEVEGVEHISPEFTDVVIARILEIRPHPEEGKRENICVVDFGEGRTAEVVCGADNARAGCYYPYAKKGATLPGGITVAAREIKGVVSEGMLCSEAELGLSDDAGCIMELNDKGLSPGMDIAEFLQLNDTVFELSLTPNRGDCLSLRGIAREVGALNQLHINSPDITDVPPANDLVRQIKLAAPEACPRYVGRVIQGIDIKRRSPSWMLEKLRRCGLRSVNVIVDVSNYVMLELGQPTHAFDNTRLTGGITVRYAHLGEEITLLDGQDHVMTEKNLVIADEKNAVAMAGIMGGLSTAVSDSTRDIFLESAFFTPQAISGRAREFGMHTDASHRYERGVDYELQRMAVERVSQLIVEICGGKPGPIIEACSVENLPERQPVSLEFSHLSRLLGKKIDKEEAVDLLSRLDLAVTADDKNVHADIPSFRFDLVIPEDLIEEIARLHGYKNIPSSPPRVSLEMRRVDDVVTIDDYRRTLVERDYYEVITYSFVDEKLQSMITGTNDALPLLNPISTDMGVMRQSLLPGLLQALQYNLKRQQQRIRLFEYGLVFVRDDETGQIPMLGGLIHGEVNKKQWDKKSLLCDFYDIKGDVEALLDLPNGGLQPEYRVIEDIALHPGQSAEIVIDNQCVGRIGAIHPGILRQLDIPPPVYAFELEYGKTSPKRSVKFSNIPKYPSVRRDISILVDEKIAVAELMNCIKNSSSELLDNLELFDLYQGEGIDLGKKSLALGLTFQGSSSTLMDEEVEGIMEQLLGILHSKFGATLRE